MKLTRQGEYAIRAILELTRNYKKGLVSAKCIADVQEIPQAYLIKILSALTKSGIILSRRGNAGGIKLAKDPKAITVREVIEAVEGPYILNTCLAEAGECGKKEKCKVHRLWQRAQLALHNELNITFDELI